MDRHSLLDRLRRAFHSPASYLETGAAVASKERRAMGFGFQDSVYLLGAMAFATLLRYRAARQLAELYQSGAFWHTPTGWLIEALQAVDPALARQVCDRFIRHLRAGDFRKGGSRHAPWECFGFNLAGAQNPVYMTSVTLPLGVLQRMRSGRL